MRLMFCGANLFRQWFSEVSIVKEFIELPNFGDSQLNLRSANIKDINWAYNILEIRKSLYIVGSWIDNKSNVSKIPIPDFSKCLPKGMSDSKEISLLVAGNDFNILIVHPKLHTIWFIDIEDMTKVKEVKINIEAPVESNTTKKMKMDDHVIKVLATNNTCLLLTHYGVVYEGFLPSMVPTIHCTGSIVDIQCGFEHFVLLTDAGRVYTWGNGRRLQLGHGDLANLETPTEVEALAGIKMVKISAGGWHTLALSEHGDLYSWGWNDTGQLGIKPDDSDETIGRREVMQGYPVPTVVDLYDDNNEEVSLYVIDAACGSRHSCILLEDYSVWTSGNNKYGQLGCPNVNELNFFRKTFQCDSDSKLSCGLWSTVISRN